MHERGRDFQKDVEFRTVGGERFGGEDGNLNRAPHTAQKKEGGTTCFFFFSNPVRESNEKVDMSCLPKGVLYAGETLTWRR